VTPEDQDLLSRVFRGVGILSLILIIPVAALSLLLGPIMGLLGLMAALPLSAYLSGFMPDAADPEELLDLLKKEPHLHAVSAITAVLFALGALTVTPVEMRAIPALAVILVAFFSFTLYLISVLSGSVREIPAQVGAPLMALALASLILP
jgi:hypothetical protein